MLTCQLLDNFSIGFTICACIICAVTLYAKLFALFVAHLNGIVSILIDLFNIG